MGAHFVASKGEEGGVQDGRSVGEGEVGGEGEGGGGDEEKGDTPPKAGPRFVVDEDR